MPRFFTEYINENDAVICGEDAHHITRSLRMTVGDKLTLCNFKGTDFECEITDIGDEQVKVKILSSSPTHSEPKTSVTLYQALPKGDKFELIIQKSVELGVTKIVPFISGRCISRPDDKKLAKKLERWQKIAVSAAKQCGRGIIPTVEPVMNFESAAKDLCSHKLPIVFYEFGGEKLSKLLDNDISDIGVMIGSEGGFEQSEIETAKSLGATPATLGKRILRCETAPLCVMSIIMYQKGDME